MEKYDFMAHREESFRRVVRIQKGETPVDLTDYTAQSEIRTYPGAEDLIAALDCSIDAENGKIILSLSSEQTGGIASGTYAYDLRLIDPDGNIRYLIGGQFIIWDSVTYGSDH